MADKKAEKRTELFIRKTKSQRRRNPDPARRHRKKLGPRHPDRVRR
jgi:hypothetical protein